MRKARILSLITVFAVLLITASLAFGVSFKDAAEGYSTVVETHHKMNNMYFYGGVALFLGAFAGLGKIRQGGQMRPRLSRAVAAFLYLTMAVIILCFAMHFLPETSGFFNWLINFFKRILS